MPVFRCCRQTIRLSEAFRDASVAGSLVRDVKGNSLAKSLWAEYERATTESRGPRGGEQVTLRDGLAAMRSSRKEERGRGGARTGNSGRQEGGREARAVCDPAEALACDMASSGGCWT